MDFLLDGQSAQAFEGESILKAAQRTAGELRQLSMQLQDEEGEDAEEDEDEGGEEEEDEEGGSDDEEGEDDALREHREDCGEDAHGDMAGRPCGSKHERDREEEDRPQVAAGDDAVHGS